MNDRSGVTGAIISGGPATRFGGRPKGLEKVGGIRVIDRVATALSSATDALIIASSHPDAAAWIPGVPIAPDVLPVRASVTGIHAALVAARSAVMAIAWDMPFVPAPLVAELVARLAAGATAVVPRPAGAEPLCAAYSATARGHIEAMTAGGLMKLASILERLPGVEFVEAPALRRFGDPEVMFFNVNSAADLERAQAIARSL